MISTKPGTPDRSGRAEVVVAVTLGRDVRRLDQEALKWGNEKVLSSGTERIGHATQGFVIEVGPQRNPAARPRVKA